ncbi:MAG: sugar phosphate isomerase/epimerase family protein [Candidatus Nanopelagicales bacterium]
MGINLERVALNPLQYMATPDGWLDPGLAPALDEQLAFIAAQGFNAIQVAIPAGMTAAEYRAALDAAGFVAGPGYIQVRHSADAGERAASVDAVKAAAGDIAAAGGDLAFLAMGMTQDAPRVAVSAAVGHDFSQGRLDEIIEQLGAAAELVKAEGVTPALHPHVGTWVETEAETRAVLEAIPADVLRFGPDTGHLTWAGANTVGLLKDYASRIAGIHIKDLFSEAARRGREERLPYQQAVLQPLWTEPGTGDVDFDELFDALGDDFSGWTLIEVDRGNRPTPEESIVLCGEWYRARRA